MDNSSLVTKTKEYRTRLIERYEKLGMDSLLEYEILEFCIFKCYPKARKIPDIHKLLEEHGSLHNILDTVFF